MEGLDRVGVHSTNRITAYQSRGAGGPTAGVGGVVEVDMVMSL